MQLDFYADAPMRRKPPIQKPHKRHGTAKPDRKKRERPPVLPSSWRPLVLQSDWLTRFLAHFQCGRFLTLLRPLDAPRRLFPAIPATTDDPAALPSAWPAELRLNGWPYPGADLVFFDGEAWSDSFEPWSAPIGTRGPRQPLIMATAERLEITTKGEREC